MSRKCRLCRGSCLVFASFSRRRRSLRTSMTAVCRSSSLGVVTIFSRPPIQHSRVIFWPRDSRSFTDISSAVASA